MIKTLDIEQLKKIFAAEQKELLKEYFEFLRFQTIATDLAYKSEVDACANWVANYLKKLGFSVERWKGERGDILFGELRTSSDKPTVMLYNHYDVQPVDPLDLWTTPPFEPALREGRIYARGASDNKGQCFYTLAALKVLLREMELPINLKYLIEGEEESGSHSLFNAVEKHKAKLKADYLLIIDSGVESLKKPAITLGARGIVAFDLTVTGSAFDLHSGSHGGMAYNPNRALVELLASTHDKNGKVTIPHFYDGITPLSSEEKKDIAFEFDEGEYVKLIEQKPTAMEKGFAPLEANWIRPTLEINGISGGYAGKGFKTVIPAKAFAKVSCRLVPGQDPQKVAQSVKDYFQTHLPGGLTIDVSIHQGAGQAFYTSPHTEIARVMAKAYSDVFKKECRNIMIGGSIPITTTLAKASGAETLLMGVSIPEDKIHSPNESFGLDQLQLGFLVMAHALQLF